jgi:hypothetical protein
MEDYIGDDRDCVQGPDHTDRDQPRLAAAIESSLPSHEGGGNEHRDHHQAEDEGTGRRHVDVSGEFWAIDRRPSRIRLAC